MKKVCDASDVKEGLFCDEYLVTLLKWLKNNKVLGADSVVNGFLIHGGYEVRNKLMKIMDMIFENGEVPSNFKKTQIKPL